ncbi:hypothetical protein ACF0H5_020267 [Mactra antiquata]
MSTFNVTRAQTASIHSIGFGISLGLGVIWGMIVNRLGTLRCGIFASILASCGLMSCYFATSVLHMTISISFVYGTGYSALAICVPVAIGEHFNEGRRKILLLSIVNTGGAVGGIIYPFILRYLSDWCDFRGALLILGGFTMNCIPTCFLWKLRISRRCSTKSRKYEQDSNSSIQSDFSKTTIDKNKTVRLTSRETNVSHDFVQTIPIMLDDSQTRRVSIQNGYLDKVTSIEETDKYRSLKQNFRYLIKNTRFMLFVVGFVIAYPALSLIMIFIADIYEDKSLTVEDATLALQIMNIVGIFGRIIPGLLMQCQRVPTLFCPLVATLLGTVVLLGMLLTTSRPHLLFICAINGISSGMFSSMYSVIAAKLVDIKSLPTAYGVLFTSSGIGYAIAGPVCGYMRDIYSTYSVPLYGAAGMTFLSFLLFLIALSVQAKEKKKFSKPIYDLN